MDPNPVAVTLAVIGVLVLCIFSSMWFPAIVNMLPKRVKPKCREECGSMGWDVVRKDYERKHCKCRKCGWVHEKPRSYLAS